MINRSIYLILFLCLLLPLTALAESDKTKAQDTKQTESTEAKKPLELDQVLQNYYKAIGGLEKWRSLNTMIMKGEMNSQGTTMPITAYHARPNKCRVEFKIDDTVMAQIFSGALAWQINPLSGNPEPAPMTAGRSSYMRDTCDIENSLIDYKKKGHEVKLLGEEELNGKNFYKISVKYQSGNHETYYIDAENYMIDKYVGIYSMDGNEVRTTTNFRDYKDTDGYVVPYNLIIEIHGSPSTERLRINEFLFNPEIDTNIFEFPKEKMININKKKQK